MKFSGGIAEVKLSYGFVMFDKILCKGLVW